MSDEKTNANRLNAVQSTGPRTEAGKRKSSRNALKSGFYARELVVKAEEQPEFEALRASLRRQFAPATAMQLISFDQVVCCGWRCKLALRVEASAMGRALGMGAENAEENDSKQGVTLSQWVGASRENMRKGIRFLGSLRADVRENGLIHLEQDGPLKESIVKGLGQQFYDGLTEWRGFDVSAIQLVQHLEQHRKNFPSDSDPLNASAQIKVVPDPKLKWEMVVKLIDLHTQHLRDLLAATASRQVTDVQLEVYPRYFAAASRDLREAVDWYLYLRSVKL